MKNLFCTKPDLDTRIADSRDRLYRVALAWCGDRMLAEDLVQETLTAGISRKQQLRDPEKLYAWLYSILNNRWRNYLRSKKPHSEIDDELPTPVPGPEQNCEELDLVLLVRQAVTALPLVERQVVSLVDLDELSYCDVAEILEIPIGTVMSRLHRARKHLLTRIQEQDRHTRSGLQHIRIVE